MRVAIQANGFEMTGALRSYTEQRVATAFGRVRYHLHKLAVSLSDINGPRGGIDKRCKIQVQLGGGREVIIDEREADLYVAIGRAVERAGRAVARQIGRTRRFAHQRLAGAELTRGAATDIDIDTAPAHGPGTDTPPR